jgi:energy-coupling factor transporter ATP-binding protein EcfA2
MPKDPPNPLAYASPVLTPGQRLADRYLIDALLGWGGMGAVYRARDEQTDQPVAIKTILAATGGEQIRRFRREFRALIRLRHPNIVTVQDSGQVEGVPFYVMEYVDGPDLAQLLGERGGPLTVAETVAISIQVGQALAYIHNQGIIHRDIKPSNIMLLRSDPGTPLHVKLMDFGLIKMADVSAQLTSSDVFMGTLQYLSPEQGRGLAVDRRSDLYALGLVLFELSTGKFPFSGSDPFSIALQRLLRSPVSPVELQPDLPSILGEAILKLLAEDLAERYASAEELLADLAPLAEDSVVLAPAPPPRADIMARSPLVGRDAELERLADWLQAAWAGPGKFVLIEGEAGVGKTRLSQELAGLARQQGGRRLRGSCYEEERLPYGPIAEALRDAIRSGGERFVPLLEGLRPELVRLVPGLTLPLGEPAPVLEPEQARLRLFDAVTSFLVRLSQRRPIVLILEDLQWADEGTLELLHYLVRNSQEASVFVLGTARREELDEEHPLVALLQAMNRRGLVERLPLERLPPEAVADLITGMLAGGPPPTQLAERLYREAEGNPFFVEELLRVWVEEGRLVWKNGRWSLVATDSKPGVSALSIPASVADVVARRLRGVTGVERDVLTLVAVLGREFNFDVLLHMALDLSEDPLLDAIDDLLRARLLEEVDHPREDRYRFAHNKIQEVVYTRASANQRRLRRLHHDAGRALEQVYAGRLDRVVEPLARHFLEAGDRRGIDYATRAGDAARAVYANQEALDYYRGALAPTRRRWTITVERWP